MFLLGTCALVDAFWAVVGDNSLSKLRVSLLLARASSLEGSGDQDGLAGQLPGGGQVVDGGQVGQRSPLRDVDL